MQPLALVREWEAQDPSSRRALQVPDVNHYTIAVGRRGAEAVAAEIVRALDHAAADRAGGRPSERSRVYPAATRFRDRHASRSAP